MFLPWGTERVGFPDPLTQDYWSFGPPTSLNHIFVDCTNCHQSIYWAKQAPEFTLEGLIFEFFLGRRGQPPRTLSISVMTSDKGCRRFAGRGPRTLRAHQGSDSLQPVEN